VLVVRNVGMTTTGLSLSLHCKAGHRGIANTIQNLPEHALHVRVRKVGKVMMDKRI